MKRSAFISDGVTLSVAGTGHGHPFIFQHGLCGDAAQTAQVFPGDAGFRCLTVECRGHGQSTPGDVSHLSLATFATDIVRFIEERHLDRPVLGGISMGAAISLRVAVHFPELVKALVIARPAWLVDPAPVNMHPNSYAGELIDAYPPDEALRNFDASTVAAGLKDCGPDNLASIRGFFFRRPSRVTAALLRQISADGPAVKEAEIRSIRLPTLIIGNRGDYVHPISYARTLADWVPNARFVEVTPKAEDLEQYRFDFKSALASFLTEIS